MIAVFLAMPVINAFATGDGEKGGEAVTLTMGSWRVDDVKQIKKICDAFSRKYPDIRIKFDPTNPPEYNAVLRTQLEGGTAPDLFYLRSFGISRQLYKEGYLENLKGLPGLNDAFTKESIMPWADTDGTPYGVPLLAVSHGIYYNVDIFKKLSLSIPGTWPELIKTARAIKDAGYVPFANASGDEWTIAEIVFMNLAPAFIGGYEGRMQYETGKRCFNDEHVAAAFQAVADMAPYLPKGQEALNYYDSQQLFLMQKAAMWMGGSWDISFFESENPDFEWSVFATPGPTEKDKYICFHMDAGMGLNSKSKYKAEAKLFLEWLTTKEAATLFGNELPGFFPVHKDIPSLTNKHADAFLSLNKGRGLDVRWAWPSLLDGSPDGYSLMQNNAILILKGELTAKQAADALQKGLAQWFEPAKNCGN